MMSTGQIVKDCRAGKRKAQNLLYRMYSAQMLGVCMRYGNDLHEAEDMLQEGFIKVFQNIRQYKGTGPLQAWIRRIIVNTAINHLKRNARHKLHFDYSDGLVDDIADESEEDYPETDPEVIIGMIRDLPEGYRMVLNLFVFEGFGHKEIAGLLGISENTSKTQLFKARESLKKKLSLINNPKEGVSHG
ncbi:MAG: sigma-70 family RNA polymerase sigma factor [Bacteroidales bacterium]|nr:sigma-70 family RNA polymerase sigma factor [Bacteroidales bacterium]